MVSKPDECPKCGCKHVELNDKSGEWEDDYYCECNNHTFDS